MCGITGIFDMRGKRDINRATPRFSLYPNE
jgi:hypothetical protein